MKDTDSNQEKGLEETLNRLVETYKDVLCASTTNLRRLRKVDPSGAQLVTATCLFMFQQKENDVLWPLDAVVSAFLALTRALGHEPFGGLEEEKCAFSEIIAVAMICKHPCATIVEVTQRHFFDFVTEKDHQRAIARRAFKSLWRIIQSDFGHIEDADRQYLLSIHDAFDLTAEQPIFESRFQEYLIKRDEEITRSLSILAKDRRRKPARLVVIASRN